MWWTTIVVPLIMKVGSLVLSSIFTESFNKRATVHVLERLITKDPAHLERQLLEDLKKSWGISD